MKVKFSVRGANYATAIFLADEDRQKDVAWIMRVLSPQPPAWVRVVDACGQRIIVMPRSDHLHID
jgi:hypothetical protein